MDLKVQYAGRLQHFYDQWSNITNDEIILSWIQGYTIPFKCIPFRTDKPCTYPKSQQESDDFNICINKLLIINAISYCDHEPDEFISSVFLVPKPNGDKRFIINLKCLNKFIETKHFKMEDYRSASRLVTKDCYMASIDLQDAYFLVPINKSQRKFLRFIYNDIPYQINCLPFGLCTSPFVFTKLLKPVMEYLRYTHGLISVIYLDDIFCVGRTFSECKNNVTLTKTLLESVGFLINFEKSCFEPKTICKFLGFMFDSKRMLLELPNSKKSKIKSRLTTFLNLKKCSLREFARFVGLLVSACPAIRYSWVYTKYFEQFKFVCLLKNPNYDQIIELPEIIKPDIIWWLNHIDYGFNQLDCEEFDLEIFSDASTSGWGAYYNNNDGSGYWKDWEKKLHINELELKAAFLALKCFTKNLSHSKILLRIDNVTAISCINRMGSVQYSHLNKITREIWQWCEMRKLTIFASYINTKDNCEADQLSRKNFEDTEWELNKNAFDTITSSFGYPEIDLFASRCNAKCNKFVTWKNDPEAWAVDAFTISWKNRFFYAFPPFCLITKVIQKIIREKAEGILVVPYWKGQVWYPILQKIINSDLILFGPDPDLLTSPFRIKHNLHRALKLVAVKLSGSLY